MVAGCASLDAAAPNIATPTTAATPAAVATRAPLLEMSEAEPEMEQPITTIADSSPFVRTFESAWAPSIEGLLTFRGNANRRYYGMGPLPRRPEIAWSYPKSGSMCQRSSAKGETKVWCGAGWTGQPTVHERDGKTWLIFNGYDGAVHFVDADTGENLLEPFQTGDIIKGTVTVDPDGYPLVYTGSRDNFFRVLAIDRPGGKAVELWRLSSSAVSPTLWNDDWDGSALVLDDYLLEGGENSQFHVVKLNRTYTEERYVRVAPQLVFNTPGWDDELRRDLRGRSSSEVSIENSVAVDGDVVYFANSGGLVQGWDLAPLRTGGTPTRVFRFWAGDDVDASIVIDDDGMLYVGVENERGLSRSKEVGQLVKLDPTRADDPVIWSFFDDKRLGGGIWSTAAIDRGVVIATTDGGRVVGLDQQTGDLLWEFTLPGPLWQSPVVIDDVLIQGDCAGTLRGYDMSDPRQPPAELWGVELGGCIEATPAVWKGSIYLATRGGKFFALRDRAN